MRLEAQLLTPPAQIGALVLPPTDGGARHGRLEARLPRDHLGNFFGAACAGSMVTLPLTSMAWLALR